MRWILLANKNIFLKCQMAEIPSISHLVFECKIDLEQKYFNTCRVLYRCYYEYIAGTFGSVKKFESKVKLVDMNDSTLMITRL